MFPLLHGALVCVISNSLASYSSGSQDFECQQTPQILDLPANPDHQADRITLRKEDASCSVTMCPDEER